MVRAGVVRHPSEWLFGGYDEIRNPAKRYSIIDQKSLLGKCGVNINDNIGLEDETIRMGNKAVQMYEKMEM